MIIESGGRQVAVLFDEDVPCPSGTHVLEAEQPSSMGLVNGVEFRTLVELRRIFGGMGMRALLGGIFAPMTGATVVFQVLADEQPLRRGQSTSCPSSLGSSLVCGLPSDLAKAALDGLLEGVINVELPGGTLRVDRAGHDEVESSESAFRQAGNLLAVVIGAHLSGGDPASVVRGAMDRW